MNEISLKNIDRETLQEVVDKHNSISAIMRELKISETCPHNRKLLKIRMESDINPTEYEKNKIINNPFSNSPSNKLDDENFFNIGDKRRSGVRIKERLLNNKKWEYSCSMCGLSSIWNNKPLSLHIDHINGNPFDNRLENLRFICPNCHSQTDTFGSKNRK
jgi:Zn finger protein HypA/HybF involved in hydrogenase expression